MILRKFSLELKLLQNRLIGNPDRKIGKRSGPVIHAFLKGAAQIVFPSAFVNSIFGIGTPVIIKRRP